MQKAHVRTDFAQYSHQQLWAMLFASDPATIREAADKWDAVGQWLHAQSGDLDKELGDFDTKWSGGAAAQYHSMMKDLSGGIRTVAQNAWTMRDNAHGSADALDTARAQMPAPVDVPDVSPTTMSMASAPVVVDASTSPEQAAAMQQQQAQAAAAVQQQQQAQANASAAHARAVAVMTTLADHYTVDEDAIPETPSASGRVANAANSGGVGIAGGLPGLDGGGPAIASIVGADGLPISGMGTDAATDGSGLGSILPSRTGIFGGMFAAGIAAASAASLGRFGSILPRVPAFAGGSSSGKKGAKDASHPGGGSGAPGGIGGGGGGGAGGLDTSTAPGDAPTAYHGMSSGGSSLSNGLTAAAAAAPIAARAGMGGFMPAMPYGAGMAGGDNGGSKRIPPWLVETEDVWGESSAVSPSVIGEQPADDTWLG